jgi:hypothetical protein
MARNQSTRGVWASRNNAPILVPDDGMQLAVLLEFILLTFFANFCYFNLDPRILRVKSTQYLIFRGIWVKKSPEMKRGDTNYGETVIVQRRSPAQAACRG